MNAMKPAKWRSAFILAFCLMLLLFAVTLAQSGGDFQINWSAIAGGGGASAGGNYTLGGTAGQAAAGMIAGGDYSMVSGVTGGGVPVPPTYGTYLPVVSSGG